jgi:hypothetical protein
MPEPAIEPLFNCAWCERKLTGRIVQRSTGGWVHAACIIPWLREVEPDRWTVTDRD